jgi:hypothetical protein
MSATPDPTRRFAGRVESYVRYRPSYPRAALDLLGDQPRFISVAGTAEDTTLDDSSVDFVVAGQAFHWFDLERSRTEFARILRSDGWVVLI